MSQHTIVNSQLVSAAKAGIFLQRPGDSLVGKRDRWRERGRARHRARHVGNAIMHDAVHHVRRLAVRGRERSFRAAALIDGNIDQNGTAFHGCNGL